MSHFFDMADIKIAETMEMKDTKRSPPDNTSEPGQPSANGGQGKGQELPGYDPEANAWAGW
jgi:hypothetical protein